MKIPFLQIQFKIKKLHIKPIYTADKIVIPIGCDCHPAHLLEELYLRKHSLPFDWLLIQPGETIPYVADCVKTKFRKAFIDLMVNENYRVVSRNYPQAVFFHAPSIIYDKNIFNKLILRASKFNELVQENDIYYLCNISLSYCTKKEQVNKLVQDILEFITLLKENDSLHIYFTSDYSENENPEMSAYLLSCLENIVKVKAILYFKNRSKYGLWGNKKCYISLLKGLDINIKKVSKFKIFTSS